MDVHCSRLTDRSDSTNVGPSKGSNLRDPYPFLSRVDRWGARTRPLCGNRRMGIEAISRGASFALFVDNSQEALSILKANLKRLMLEEQAAFLDATPLDWWPTAASRSRWLFWTRPMLWETLNPHFALSERARGWSQDLLSSSKRAGRRRNPTTRNFRISIAAYMEAHNFLS